MLKLVILGAIQGLTEFFPVSSSGHLVIAQHIFGINQSVVFLDIILHIGTLLAVLTFFFPDICSALKNPKTIGYIVIVTFVTGIIGTTFKNIFKAFFDSGEAVAAFLIINGLILILTRYFRDKQKEPGLLDSVFMGLAQGLAITPGISRSGLTITSLLSRGINREKAFNFSFIASLPAIVGAFILEAKDATGFSSAYPIQYLALGVITAYITGLCALFFLKRIIKNNTFFMFGYYCLILAGVYLFFLKK